MTMSYSERIESKYRRKYGVTVPEGKKGPWEVRRFEVKKDDFGRIDFHNPGRSVPPGIYTGLFHAQRGVVMSDTQAEISDHMAAMHQITKIECKRVLIHGLGIGMVLKQALDTEHVEHVDVVEIDQDVIDLVGPHYLTDPRLTIHHGDALTFKFPKGSRWDVAWHDIWDSICDDNRPQMSRLMRRYGRATVWQDCWGKYMLDYMRRQDNRWTYV